MIICNLFFLESIKVFDGNNSIKRQLYRVIIVPRTYTLEQLLTAALRAFHITREPSVSENTNSTQSYFWLVYFRSLLKFHFYMSTFGYLLGRKHNFRNLPILFIHILKFQNFRIFLLLKNIEKQQFHIIKLIIIL